MAQRHYYFLVVLLLMFFGRIFGQENPGVSGKKSAIIPHISKKTTLRGDYWNLKPIVSANPEKFRKFLKLPVSCNTPAHFENQLHPDYKSKETLMEKTISPLFLFRSSSFPSYTSHLGFFCKQELQLDKITFVPLRFRLGSLEYVNWMEQKPNAVTPQ